MNCNFQTCQKIIRVDVDVKLIANGMSRHLSRLLCSYALHITTAGLCCFRYEILRSSNHGLIINR